MTLRLYKNFFFMDGLERWVSFSLACKPVYLQKRIRDHLLT